MEPTLHATFDKRRNAVRREHTHVPMTNTLTHMYTDRDSSTHVVATRFATPKSRVISASMVTILGPLSTALRFRPAYGFRPDS